MKQLVLPIFQKQELTEVKYQGFGGEWKTINVLGTIDINGKDLKQFARLLGMILESDVKKLRMIRIKIEEV